MKFNGFVGIENNFFSIYPEKIAFIKILRVVSS